MNEFGITYYAPGLPSHGERASATFNEGKLYINDKPADVQLSDIGVTLGGFDHKQVFLFWHQA